MVNSRLARHQQQKLLRQTVLSIVGAIVLVIVFIFVILPTFVRLVVGLSGGNTSLLSDDSVPPQLPVLAPPPIATPSATIALTGFGEPKSTVVLILNGSQQNETTVGDDSQFALDVTLTEGENTIALFARDEAGNESATTTTEYVTLDTTQPKLEISEPQDGQQIELRRNQVLTVKGATDPETTITLNGRRIFTQTDGSFTTTFQLQEGENKLDVVAVDRAGNRSEKTLTVRFKL